MKKIISSVLTLAMVGAMSVAAFAASPITEANGSDSKNVNATYKAADKVDVYSVDVTWGGMEFEYKQAEQSWNTESFKYENKAGCVDAWAVAAASDNKITVSNHSSKAVDATFSFAAASDFTGMDGQFTYGGSALTNALALEKPAADSDAKEYTVSFMPTTALSSETSTQTKIGQITVSID